MLAHEQVSASPDAGSYSTFLSNDRSDSPLIDPQASTTATQEHITLPVTAFKIKIPFANLSSVSHDLHSGKMWI